MRPTSILAVTLFLLCLHGKLAAEERERIGRAYDPNSGALLYEERHLETFADGKIITDRVHYVDPQGRTFGNKRVDFRHDPFVPEFRLLNERTGHIEALLHKQRGEIEVRYRERVDQELREALLAAPENAVADAGFDRFIESHWEQLLRGEVLKRRFLVPSRLEFMDWRVKRISDDDPATARFALEIESVLLRIVVPTITLVYERATRRLLRYEGLSNLRDESGNNHSVRIEFQYSSRSARTKRPSRHVLDPSRG